MATDSKAFKGYERGQRVAQKQETFLMGMSSADTTLQEGFSKLLVNYDIDRNGESLVPRPGIKTITSATKRDECYVDVRPSVVAASESYVDDKDVMLQIMTTGDYSEVTPGYSAPLLSDPNLVLDDINLYTIQKAYTAPEFSRAYILARSLYHKIPTDGIHGIPIHGGFLQRHVGCFAFNNEYYMFRSYLDPYPTQGARDEFNVLCKATYEPTHEGISEGFGFKAIEPKKLTPKEAAMWGYNMLDNNPYTFTCDRQGEGITLLGILTYDENDNLVLSPRVNQTLKVKVYYAAAPKKWRITLEHKLPSASDWTTAGEQTKTVGSVGDVTPFFLPFSPPTSEVILRVKVFDADAPPILDKDGKELPPKEVGVMTVGMSFDPSTQGSTANTKPEKYNIRMSKGICYWMNRLVAWGTRKAPNMLFMSDVNDPSYFPYPQGADILDEPIVHCVPLLDDLLVFTKTELYMVTLAEDGLSYTKKLIQSHLRISDSDVHLIRVVKNMVFFKSGNYYYMVVPKLNSTTGELTIAPISNNIKPLLDNFRETVENTFKLMYNNSNVLSSSVLIDYYNYLDFEDINNVYVFYDAMYDRYINVCLLYNSVGRYWRMYMYESSSKLYSLANSATSRGKLVGVERVPTGYTGEGAKITVVSFASDDPVDKINDKVATVCKNYQYLDTGLREIDSDYKKRFREVQLKLNNKSQSGIIFSSKVCVDDNLKVDFVNAQGAYDEVNDNVTVLEPTFVDDVTIPDVVTPVDYYWLTGSNKLPLKSLYKIRMPIMGKGYAPRLQLRCTAEKKFELLNINWIYRQLYSR